MSIAYSFIMTKHSVAEAKNRLSELIDLALEGEGVIITRGGRPVVQLTPISEAPKPITPDAIDWLKQRRVGRRMPREDAVATVRRIRDEWGR
jgi:prevent-host-death family protein